MGTLITDYTYHSSLETKRIQCGTLFIIHTCQIELEVEDKILYGLNCAHSSPATAAQDI